MTRMYVIGSPAQQQQARMKRAAWRRHQAGQQQWRKKRIGKTAQRDNGMAM